MFIQAVKPKAHPNPHGPAKFASSLDHWFLYHAFELDVGLDIAFLNFTVDTTV